MLDALKTIAALLHKYAPRRVDFVEDLLRALAARDPNAALDVCGDELWGDEGLWDTGPQVMQRPHHDAATCRSDELAYRRAFLDLVASIEREGLGTKAQLERIREVAATFQTWERDGL